MKTLFSILFLIFTTQAFSEIRVIPCKSVDCNNQTATRKVSISVASKLSEGRHEIYFYNTETKNTFFYTVNKFYEPELRRLFVRARGPATSSQTMDKYIKDVYALEEDGVWPIIGIPQPNIGSVQLGSGMHHGVWFSAFPLLNASAQNVSGMIQLGNAPFGSSPWISGMNSAVFTYLVQNSNLTPDQVTGALNRAMGQVSLGNRTGTNVGFVAEGGMDGIVFEGSIEGTYTKSDGTTSNFQFNVLSPSTSILYPDGMIVLAWVPGEGFQITHVIDEEGNVINFEDGKLAIDTTQNYIVSTGNAELWAAIVEAMGIRNAGDMALLTKLRNLKKGFVKICGGVGFPPCPAT